jgi:hypothetical protein
MVTIFGRSGLRILKGAAMDTSSPDWLTVESQTPESAVVRHCSQIDALYRIISTEGYHHLSAGGCRPLVVTRICGDRGRPTAIVLSVQDSKSCGEGFVRLYENVGARFKFAGRAQSLIRTKLACELHEWACNLHCWIWGDIDEPIQRLQQGHELEVA